MKALLIWNNLWADRHVCFIHPLPGTSELPVLCAETCFPVSSNCRLLLLFFSSPSPVCLSLSLFLIIFFLTFHLHFLSVALCFSPLSLHSGVSHSLFPLFLITSNSLSVSFPLTLPLHFHFSTSPPLFTFSLQRGHRMNNSSVAGW